MSTTWPRRNYTVPANGKITEPQRRALFACAHAKGLGIDDIRALTPAGSISMMTAAQAAAVLDRLNGVAPASVAPANSRWSGGTGRRPRKPEGVIRLVSAEQKALIVSLRMELGWTAEQLTDWLQKRHYKYDPKRSMDQMDSTADAVAVIELLKAVRARTFSSSSPSAESAKSADKVLRPHKRQLWTITDRLQRIARARNWTTEAVKQWARTLKLKDGREAHAMCTTADASEVIEILTRELAKEAAR